MKLSACLALVLLLAGCGADVLFVGDPALEAITDAGRLESDLREAASRRGMRVDVVWPSAERLDALDLDAVLAERDERVVALSPYLSLLAADLAGRYPDRTFVAFYGAPDVPNVIGVEFEADAAMREAGRALARWVFAEPARTAVLLVDESERDIREEARALGAGYEDEAGVALPTEAFATPPTRDAVRSRIDAVVGGGRRGVVVLLGEASGWAYEALRDESDVRIGYRNAYMRSVERSLFTVRDDPATGLDAALAALAQRRGASGVSGDGIRVVAPAVLELSPTAFPEQARTR
jgi:hypothetical protein